jgi:catalase
MRHSPDTPIAAGAFFGQMTITHDLSRFTCAKLFSRAGNACDMHARFSTIDGQSLAAEDARCQRGYALTFSDFIPSQQREKAWGERSASMQWELWSQAPEALHQVSVVFSSRVVPATLRHMDGHSSHAYCLWNASGDRHWAKWHFNTMLGTKSWDNDRAAMQAAGADLDFHRRDLHDAIDRADFPKWQVQVQLMTELKRHTLRPQPFDVPQRRSLEDCPLLDVGEFELLCNPKNH